MKSDEFAQCKIRKSFKERVENKELQTGVILGVVELYDVVEDSANLWARRACYHFKLRNPRLLQKPILTRGYQKLWIPSPQLKRAILHQL
jgi:hypothetical protein